MRNQIGQFSAAAFLALIAAPAAHASVIYAVEWGKGIYAIDPDALTVELLESHSRVWSISASHDPDILYVSSYNGGLQAYSLSKGTLSPIGGQFQTNSLGRGEDGFLYSGSWSNGDLRRVDPNTGSSTVVGRGSISGYAGDLVAAPDGQMYGVSKNNEIVHVDTEDGSTETVHAISGLDVWGMATTFDGRFWLNSGRNLYELDMTTGGYSHVMDLGFTAYDLASVPGVTFGDFVPTPPVAFAGFLCLMGLNVRRSRSLG